MITSRQAQENTLDVVTCMIKDFTCYVYSLLRSSLSFVTPYVEMNFHVIPKYLSKTLSVSRPVGESTLAKRVYRDYHVSINHNRFVGDLVELDMVGYDFNLCMDLLHTCYALVDFRDRLVMFSFQISQS